MGVDMKMKMEAPSFKAVINAVAIHNNSSPLANNIFKRQ
jgi:hypothetical protein